MNSYLSNSRQIIERNYLQIPARSKYILNQINSKEKSLDSSQNKDRQARLKLKLKISILNLRLKYSKYIDQLKLDYKAKKTAEENVVQRKEDQRAAKPQGRLLSYLDIDNQISNYKEIDPKKEVQRQESIGQMFSKDPVYSDTTIAPHSPYIHDGKEFFAIDMRITV